MSRYTVENFISFQSKTPHTYNWPLEILSKQNVTSWSYYLSHFFSCCYYYFQLILGRCVSDKKSHFLQTILRIYIFYLFYVLFSFAWRRRRAGLGLKKTSFQRRDLGQLSNEADTAPNDETKYDDDFKVWRTTMKILFNSEGMGCKIINKSLK